MAESANDAARDAGQEVHHPLQIDRGRALLLGDGLQTCIELRARFIKSEASAVKDSIDLFER